MLYFLGMALSALQKFCLTAAYAAKGWCDRKKIHAFYRTHEREVGEGEQVKIITKSIERLIDRALMVGRGVRTPKKWYIEEVRLTAKGRRLARALQKAKQPQLFR